MKRIAALLCALLMCSPAGATATETFYLSARLAASPGNRPMGDLAVCVELRDEELPHISLTVAMPDAGQILSISAPAERTAAGLLAFQFHDDGWGNSGEGAFKVEGSKATLSIKQTGASPDANKNVRRNYGTYRLVKAECHNPAMRE